MYIHEGILYVKWYLYYTIFVLTNYFPKNMTFFYFYLDFSTTRSKIYHKTSAKLKIENFFMSLKYKEFCRVTFKMFYVQLTTYSFNFLIINIKKWNIEHLMF